MDQSQLIGLGIKVNRLSKTLFGVKSNPLHHVSALSERTGVRKEIILSAIYAVGGDSHESQAN